MPIGLKMGSYVFGILMGSQKIYKTLQNKTNGVFLKSMKVMKNFDMNFFFLSVRLSEIQISNLLFDHLAKYCVMDLVGN